MSTRQEKLAKLKEIEAERNIKRDAVANAAADTRLDNELLIAELEAKNHLTLHIDMGVVWLTSGDMIVVQKPEYTGYERYQLKLAEHKTIEELPPIVDEFLKICLIHPTMQEIESKLISINGDCKSAAVNLAARMHDIKGVTGK